ncbi:hypothetical protein PR048_013854 [Dryococelus australis]|uniref:Uncharacterized protein n=1 Tax=Dryococelus australis TaxID=614101 RepID=A0ABQ9HTG4_9NEOP|nr:hypothetical protein PR048_013854 [Dryococelus australis]
MRTGTDVRYGWLICLIGLVNWYGCSVWLAWSTGTDVRYGWLICLVGLVNWYGCSVWLADLLGWPGQLVRMFGMVGLVNWYGCSVWLADLLGWPGQLVRMFGIVGWSGWFAWSATAPHIHFRVVPDMLYHDMWVLRPPDPDIVPVYFLGDIIRWGCVGVVVRRLLSHLGEAGSIPCRATRGYSHVGIVPDNASSRRIFSRIVCFPCLCPLVLLHTHLTSLSSPLKTSIQSNRPSEHGQEINELAVTQSGADGSPRVSGAMLSEVRPTTVEGCVEEKIDAILSVALYTRFTGPRYIIEAQRVFEFVMLPTWTPAGRGSELWWGGRKNPRIAEVVRSRTDSALRIAIWTHFAPDRFKRLVSIGRKLNTHLSAQDQNTDKWRNPQKEDCPLQKAPNPSTKVPQRKARIANRCNIVVGTSGKRAVREVAPTYLNSLQLVQNKFLTLAAHARRYIPIRNLNAELKQELLHDVNLKQAQ